MGGGGTRGAERLGSPCLPFWTSTSLPAGTADPGLLGAEAHEALHLSTVSPSFQALPPE